MKYNTIEIEERRARNEALIAAATNEGNGNGMNMFMGMNSTNSVVNTKPTSPKSAPGPKHWANCQQEFLHRSRWKIRSSLNTKDEKMEISKTSQLIKLLLTFE